MRIVRRTAVLIVIGLTLGTPWVGASPLSWAGVMPHQVLGTLGGLLTSLWFKTGCTMDPLGSYAPRPQTQSTDTGCTVDPNGRCALPPQTQSADEGCTMDPLGRCTPDH
ncbi:MAG TPA: hypothetical protein VLV54_14540 [Thermoanaerobaculia bacterium]|nr:hypothetical protein [Thermoanaerobaculia bacterium]